MTERSSSLQLWLTLLLLLCALCPSEGQPRNAGPRIAGALVRVAPTNRFPYMCSLRRNGDATHVCGAFVVHKRWVVTAAHCVDPDVGGSTGFAAELYCGVHFVDDDNKEQRYVSVDGRLHDSWSGDTFEGFDIAMLKLDKDFPFAVPRLNFAGNPPKFDQSLGAIGWGKVDKFTFADELQIAHNLVVVSRAECDRAWKDVEIKQDLMLCTSVSLSDTCEGDSGGPLLLPHRPRNVLADGDPSRDLIYGITSFGRRDCEPNTSDERPAVYTSIGYFSEWIQQIIDGDPGVPKKPSKEEDVVEPVSDNQTKGDSQEGRFPYMCSLRSESYPIHVCGGTLIHPQWVLTSALCVDPANPNSAGTLPTIHCGGYGVNTAPNDQVFAGVSFVHEEWTGETLNGYDIALIKLDRAANGPVPTLSSPGNTLPPGVTLTLPGWGETPKETFPTNLQLKSIIPVESHGSCSRSWGIPINADTMLCAGIGENDACRGDAGSPLMQLEAPGGAVGRGSASSDLLIGVSSFHDQPCGSGKRPGVYTNVGYFRDWIMSTIASNTER